VTSISNSRIFGGAFPAALAAERISDERSLKEERAAMAIPDAPAEANARAVARPTPLDAPVTRT
jgi:hypothetical protein